MSHSRQPEPLDELRALIHALHDDRITPEDKARLEAWVCRDKEARRVYVGYMYLYAWLQWDHRRQAPTLASPSRPVASPVVPVVGLLGDVLRAGVSFLSRSFVLTLLLTIGLPAILIVLLVVDMARQPVPVAPAAVGQITRLHECVWDGANGGASPGEGLLAGQELRLQSGLVEVTFLDGAKVIVRGPATFRLDGAGAGLLRAGSLAATVPPAARGFTIETPSATVVDLGTEFGVLVTADGTSEAHVFDGQVEVAAKPTSAEPTPSKNLLRVGQAARVQLVSGQRAASVERIAVSAEQFVRQLPTVAPQSRRLIAAVDRHNGAAFSGVMDGSLKVQPTCAFDGDTDPAPSDEAGLRLGTVPYSDRPYKITRIDEPLVGADYVRVYNSDKDAKAHVDSWYDVTLATDRQEVFLMLLIDDRFRVQVNQQAIVDQIVARFAGPGEFVDTGLSVEVHDRLNARSLRVFGRTVPTRDKAGNPIKYAFGNAPLAPMDSVAHVIAATAEPPQNHATPSKQQRTGTK